MLHEIEALEIRRIAELALAVRNARNRLLEKVRDADLGEPNPARGEHHPVGSIDLDALPGGESVKATLCEALATLPAHIRRSLWIVRQIGRGDWAPKDWERAAAEISTASDETITADLVAAVDLHDELMKGLYELGFAE